MKPPVRRLSPPPHYQHMSCSKRWSFMKVLTDGGCACSKKATDVIKPEPEPKSKPSSDKKTTHLTSSSASSDLDDDCPTTITLSSENHDRTKCSRRASPRPKIHDSHAVVKVSDDPRHDFRQSMLEMIFQNEIYSRDDLEQLLRCFLELNSPHHHEAIVKAFLEICNGGATVPGGGQKPAPPCSSARWGHACGMRQPCEDNKREMERNSTQRSEYE